MHLTSEQLYLCTYEVGAHSYTTASAQAEAEELPANQWGTGPLKSIVAFYCDKKKYMFTPKLLIQLLIHSTLLTGGVFLRTGI